MARGQVNHLVHPPARSVAEILRANVLTRFNAILGALLAVIVVVGPFQDALFGVVLVANATIGIFQELRAKRTLERLALLSAPMVRVLRSGVLRDMAAACVVVDDIVELGPGDQVSVDGVVLDGDLEIDESLLSGEAEPVARVAGNEILSGSFVAAGSGRYRATRVGRDSYANSLAAQARQFSVVRSELREGIDRILRFVTWVIVPTALLLVLSQLNNTGLHDALRGSVAGIGSMVPEGLVLLTTIAYAVAVLRLGRQRVLVQELAAVEGLARVDVICLDKTGTLTDGNIEVEETITLDRALPAGELGEALGALAAADPSPNASLAAIASSHPAPTGWSASHRVPFSSARKWAAVSFEGRGTWLLGAPEVLLQSGAGDEADRAAAVAAAAQADELARDGRRVLLLAHCDTEVDDSGLPPAVVPAALVVLSEHLRPHAAEILGYFAAQGVDVKIISGDSPATVGAIALQVGVAGGANPLDARKMSADPEQMGEAMTAHSVFGRVSPQQKVAMVVTLQAQGHVVAMTGDGVNDVLALKQADLGVAMGSGTGAARAVAQLVLLDDAFDV
ncbi:MAG: HAD-IC family P-type ATPase, partial [Actinomycetota bacterium]|nr:HAD-IC family P-type ATPase [Actinomycetota bacterium]